MWWEYFSFKFCPVFDQSALELSYFDQNWAKTRPLLFKIWKFSNSMDSRIVHCLGLASNVASSWGHKEWKNLMCLLDTPPFWTKRSVTDPTLCLAWVGQCYAGRWGHKPNLWSNTVDSTVGGCGEQNSSIGPYFSYFESAGGGLGMMTNWPLAKRRAVYT